MDGYTVERFSAETPNGPPQPRPCSQLQKEPSARIRCPECGSTRLWKDGLRYTKRGEIQRYICRSCGYRFSETSAQPLKKLNVVEQSRLKHLQPSSNLAEAPVREPNLPLKKLHDDPAFPLREDVASHGSSTVTVTGKTLNNLRSHKYIAEYCAPEGGAKNSAPIKGRKMSNARSVEKRAVGATEKLSDAEIKGKLVEFAWWMKKQGYADETIRGYVLAIKVLAKRGANLNSPDSVKEVIARQNWSGNRRRNVINAYTLFLKMHGAGWEKPKCTVERKIPFIPTEQELDALIAGSGKKLAALLRLLKETAMRAGEALRLEWTDIDFERCIITLNKPEKRSSPRMWKVSRELVAMLKNLPKNGQRVFGNTPYNTYKQALLRTKKRLAYKLQNPRLEKNNVPHVQTLEGDNALPPNEGSLLRQAIPRAQITEKHGNLHND